jgi:thioredoxin 1
VKYTTFATRHDPVEGQKSIVDFAPVVRQLRSQVRLASVACMVGLAGLFILGLSGCGQQTEAVPATQDYMSDAAKAATPTDAGPSQGDATQRLPRLVDIGSSTCIPCKMMKPILDDLMANRAHQFETVFIDLNKNRSEAMQYGIRVIPTQVFFDENGGELGRHEGFMSKEQILQMWAQHGYAFAEP